MGKVEKKQRIALMIEAGDLIERICGECGMNGKGDNAKYCNTKCETGIQLLEIGKMLEGEFELNNKGEKVKKHKQKDQRPEILKEAKALIEQGMSKRKAAERLGIVTSTLLEWERKFSFDLGGESRKTFSESERMEILIKASEFFEEGMSKLKAAKKAGVNIVTLREWEGKYDFDIMLGRKRRNDEECIELLKKAEILISEGMSKRKVAFEFGVHPTTITLWERKYNFNLQERICI